MPSPQKNTRRLSAIRCCLPSPTSAPSCSSFFIRPYLSYALDSPDVMGVSSLLQQATNLLIPVVSLGVAYAVIRFGLDKGNRQIQRVRQRRGYDQPGLCGVAAGHAAGAADTQCGGISGLLYLCVLASCLRTLCTQFIRARMLNRLVAIDGVLTTLSLLLYYLLFLSVFKMGATGFLLANALADLTSMVFVFIAGGCWRYFKPKAFNTALWKDMLRYCLPMIPASIKLWIINASDMFFVQGMCENYGGRSGKPLGRPAVGGYFLPQIITILGSIFYEAWQLSAVTEGDRPRGVFLQNFPACMPAFCSAAWRVSSCCARCSCGCSRPNISTPGRSCRS